MTYRNDLDALAAREAALAKEVAETARERDKVEAELEQARAEEAEEHRATRAKLRRRMHLSLAAVAIVVGGVATLGVVMLDRRGTIHVRSVANAIPTDSDRIYTCEQLAPEHAKTETATEDNYRRALAVKGLSPVTLEAVGIGDDHPLSDEQLDEQVGQAAGPWQLIPFMKDGVRRNAIAGPVVQSSDARVDVELVSDAHGGIWRVVRRPHEHIVQSYKASACQWGCWGNPPEVDEGAQMLHRTLWLLRDGQTYRGEIEIEYDAPTLDIHNTEQCEYPS